LKAVTTFFLIVFLAACASAPEPVSVDRDSVRAEKQPIRSARKVDRESDRVRQKPVRQSRPVDKEAQRCVALAMYWEARGEGRHGMLAVGSVVMNRVDDHRFPNSVCAVVYQGGETRPCQFSWWCDGKSDRPTQTRLWRTSLSVADELLTARPADPTYGALFFHSTSIRAPWRRKRTAQVGNHVFYR
jgi:N-acetylmuramoyl-L-alanine amidase